MRNSRAGRLSPKTLNKMLANLFFVELLKFKLIEPDPIKGRWEPLDSREVWVAVNGGNE